MGALKQSRKDDNVFKVRPMGLTSEFMVHDILFNKETRSVGERLRMFGQGIKYRLVSIQNDHQSEETTNGVTNYE